MESTAQMRLRGGNTGKREGRHTVLGQLYERVVETLEKFLHLLGELEGGPGALGIPVFCLKRANVEVVLVQEVVPQRHVAAVCSGGFARIHVFDAVDKLLEPVRGGGVRLLKSRLGMLQESTIGFAWRDP
jgi:hypothetical protein